MPGWANLSMLGWLAAAVVPILVHLWSRRRYREMPWAAMQYLLAAMRKRRRRLLLEQYLLLALRVLIVVLVVSVVAEPYLDRPVFSSVAGRPTHRLLVIDGSYSMDYKPTDQSRFERARQVAARIVQQSPQGDGFTLVLMAAPPQAVVSRPAFAAGEFLRELDGLRLLHGSLDLAGTLAMAERVVQAAQRDYPRLARHEVYFLTDLGRVGWGFEPRSPAVQEVQRRAERLAQAAALTGVDLGQPGAENAAIVELRIADATATTAQPVQFEVQVRSFAARAQRRQLELMVDGRRVGRQPIELAPGGQAAAAFSHAFDAPGEHAVEARLDPDPLEIDDRRYLALAVEEAVRVLCVDGRPSGRAGEGAAYYLRRALAPDPQHASLWAVRPEVVAGSDLVERDLTAYPCVFLCNVAQFTPGEVHVMEDYLGGGGSLIVFLGDRVLPERYNRLLSTDGSSRGFLPARLGPIVEQAQYRLDPLEYRHPAMAAFRGQEHTGLLTTPVAKYFRLEIPKDSKARPVVALADGDPLIVEQPVGRGRVVLVATSADASWTEMPRWPSYVPLVHELLAYCLGGRQLQKNVTVGQALQGTVPAAAADMPLRVQRPDGLRVPVDPSPVGRRRAWIYDHTTTSGFYAAQWGDAPQPRQLWAVNVDPVESDLTQLGVEELRRETWPGVPLVHQTTWQREEPRPEGRAGGRGSLHLGLLYAALALVLAETWLAWRQGYHES